MAKQSPIMKNSKPALTPELISVEDFLNTIPPAVVIEGDNVTDNTIREAVVCDDTSLEPIVDAVEVAAGLDELADDVDGVTTAASMESYKRLFHQLTTLTGHPVASVEDFPATKGGVKRFSKAIRAHAADIRQCVNIAFESYADKVDESVGTSMSNYKQALGKLNGIKTEILGQKDRFVLVNQKEAWQLFHMRNELMDLSEFKDEIKGITQLEKLIDEGIENIKGMVKGESKGVALKKFLNILLMDNTTVSVKDGRAHFKSTEAPKPSRQWTKTDWPLHLAYSLVNKEYKDGKGAEVTAVIESTKIYANVIEETKKLGPVMDKIARDTDELVKLIKTVPEDKRGDVERAASPVLELAANTIKHVTEVTYGIMKMFDRITD